MRTLKLSSAIRPLADYVADLRNDTVVLTKGKRAVAALIALPDIDSDALASTENSGFMKIIERSRADFAAGRTVSFEELKNSGLLGEPPKRASRKSGSGEASVKTRPTKPGKSHRRGAR